MLQHLKTRIGTISAVLAVALVLCVASFLLLYRLDTPAFQADEALYAEVVAESFASHDFLSFTYRDQPYFNKPPLLFWLMDASHVLLPGNAQEAARLPSALAALLLVGAVMLCVFEATGNVYAAAAGGGILATTASFLALVRTARFDSLVTLFVILSVWAFCRALQDRRWFLVFGAFIGLALLTKGPVVIFVALPILALAYAYRRVDWLRDPYFWGGAGIAALLVFPWYAYELFQFGKDFFNQAIVTQLLDRADQNLFAVPITNGEYVSYLFQYAMPWSVLFLACFLTPLFWKGLPVKTRALLLAAIAGAAGVLLVCFCMPSKVFRYLVPFYPFMAIVIALCLFALWRASAKRMRARILTACCILAIAAFCWSAYNVFLLNPHYPYGTDNPEFLQEEKTIGEILLERHVPEFYVSGTVAIRPIIFYSHIPNPDNFPDYRFTYWLYLVLPTIDITPFLDAHPGLQLTDAYIGREMSLVLVRYPAGS